jgi:hypothetical protein
MIDGLELDCWQDKAPGVSRRFRPVAREEGTPIVFPLREGVYCLAIREMTDSAPAATAAW